MHKIISGFLALLLAALLISCASVEEKQESKAHYKLGVSYLSAGQHQNAYVEFQKALNMNPKDKEVNNALGIVSLKLDDFKNAEKYFLKAVKLDPEYSEAYNNLCFFYYTRGQFNRAAEKCLKALENPLYTTPEKAYYNLGRSYYRLGNYSDAVDAFNSALKRYPSLIPAYYGLALAYNAKGDYGSAADAMSDAIELDPRFRGSRGRAEKEFRKQRSSSGGDTDDFKDYLEILKY